MVDLFPSRRIDNIYVYFDEDGNVSFQVVRTRPKGFYFRRPDGNGGWIDDMHGVRRIPYRLSDIFDAIHADQRIFIVEGEKDVQRLEDETSEYATCNPGGAGKWRSEYNAYFKGAQVVIVRDEDEAGRKHAWHVAQQLERVAKSVKVVRPANGCHDLSDHFDARFGLQRLVRVRPKSSNTKARGSTDETQTRGNRNARTERANHPKRPNMARQLVELVRGSCEAFRHKDQIFVSVKVDKRHETWLLHDRRFAAWIAGECFKRKKGTPTSTAIATALLLIEHQALFEGNEREVYQRIAPGPSGSVLVDLADGSGRAVQITKLGYSVVDDPPVHFLRPRAMLQLPEPEQGGTLEDFRDFLNTTDDGYVLLMAWLIGSYCPWGAYAILDLHGEHGSAKTTTEKALQRCSDPNKGELRAAPGDLRDLAIAAQNSRVLAYDNLSQIPPWLSDALCRISTGAGFATRRMYRDDEEIIFFARRPVMLNGIEELGTRGDLLDRMLLVMLPPISEGDREDEKSFWDRFERAWPRLMGSVFDAVSLALRKYSTFDGTELPRMADFAKFALAASPKFGGQDKLLRAIRRNTARVDELSFESNPVADPIEQFVEDAPGHVWTGNAKALLSELNLHRSRCDMPPTGWPRSPRGLSGMLRRLKPTLRGRGINAEFRDRGRQWTLDGSKRFDDRKPQRKPTRQTTHD
ncbi:MAG: hypothetical protein WCF24_04705 [Acidimicrobiales bacterium]